MEFLCCFSEYVNLGKDGVELGIQFVHGSFDVFFFIMISFLLSYSHISFCREQVKIIIFELSDEKFHADGSVSWAHTKMGFHCVIKKKSQNDLLGSVDPCSRLPKIHLWRLLHYKKTFIPPEISPFINSFSSF